MVISHEHHYAEGNFYFVNTVCIFSGKRWPDGMPKKRSLSSDEEDLAPAAKRWSQAATTREEARPPTASRDMFATNSTISTTAASATDHKENQDTAKRPCKRPDESLVVGPRGKLPRLQEARLLASTGSRPAASGEEDLFGFGSDNKTAGEMRRNTAVSVEDEDIFGFGPPHHEGRKKSPESNRPLLVRAKEEDSFGSRLQEQKTRPGTKEKCLKDSQLAVNNNTTSTFLSTSVPSTGTPQGYGELDSTGFIGKVGKLF